MTPLLFLLLLMLSLAKKAENEAHEIFHINTLDKGDVPSDHTVVKVDIPSSLVNHRHKKYKMMHSPNNGKRHLAHKPDKDYHTYHYDKWDFGQNNF